MIRALHTATLVPLVACAYPASADYFARVSPAGEFVITGIAVNPDKTNTAVYLTCETNVIDVEVLTVLTADESDLPEYKGPKVVLGYRNESGDAGKITVEGEPAITAGSILSVKAVLNAEQSTDVAVSVARGHRLDVELLHPELESDSGVKTVFADGHSMARPLAEFCPGVYPRKK